MRRWNRSNGWLTVPTAAGTFFPLRIPLGLDEHRYSSSIIEQIVTAAARFGSFRDATVAIRMMGVEISERQVIRVAHELGRELIDSRDRKVIEHRRRQLPPRTSVVPEAVVVEVDGGRIRTRASERSPGVHQAQNQEDKIACLATLRGPTFESDPQPEPPRSFENPRRVQRLVQQMKGQAGEVQREEIAEHPKDPATPSEAAEATERWSPKRLVRSCVASLGSSESFGPMMAAEAQERHFYAATRRAFVADGAAYNWAIHRGYFGDFEPIVDFLHVLCYVYASARAVSADEASGWSQYLKWMRSCWQGRVKGVIAELEVWQERWGRPPKGEAQTAEERRDPRRLVAEAKTYLTNNESRMDYPRYRREGLPTTSSLVESLVGEFNARVKSKQKHWLRPEGAESILQLRAALLSEDDRLRRYFAQRTGNPFRTKRTPKEKSNPQPAQTEA